MIQKPQVGIKSIIVPKKSNLPTLFGGVPADRFSPDPIALPLAFKDVNTAGGCEPILMAPVASAIFDKAVGVSVPAGVFDVPAICSNAKTVDVAPEVLRKPWSPSRLFK